MLDFVNRNFTQVQKAENEALALIWSRSSFECPVGKINIQELAERKIGFPFGLILEHSFVQVDEQMAFQKPDPKLSSKIEVISIGEAIAPYRSLPGFEITWHSLNPK